MTDPAAIRDLADSEGPPFSDPRIADLEEQLRKAERAHDALAEALLPFARMGQLINDFINRYGSKSLSEFGEHFRRAAAALAAIEKDQDDDR